MNKKVIRYIYMLLVVILVLVVIVIFRLVFHKKESTKFDLNKVSTNYVVDDVEGMMLYNRYQVENGLIFNFVGSNSYDDYYGYYYIGNVEELPNFLKSIILIKEADYGSWDYDMEERCYRLSLDEFKIIYNKLYGEEEKELDIEGRYREEIKVDDSSICIADTLKDRDYTKVIDTYLVNIVRMDDNIVIYERVVFIDIQDDYLYFYKDYEMKDLLYKLKNTDQVDISFINNSELVSNVLLEFQNELDIYKYTYVKGENTYYLESIEK